MKSENPKTNQIEKPKQNGGRRPGSGRKPGQLGIKARTALEIKHRIAEAADNLLNAELIEALGSFVVMKADPENPLGGYARVTDEEEIIKFIQEHKGANGRVGEYVYILAAKDGNYKSRQYLFDRAFGRPSQSVEIVEDPQLTQLKQMITARATVKGSSYEQELKLYLENYASSVVPAIREKLANDLVN